MSIRKTKKQYISDVRMLELIIILKGVKLIRTTQQFCDTINMRKGNISNIRNSMNHFTPEHIQLACEEYSVDVNWIFGFTHVVFTTKKKRYYHSIAFSPN